MRLVFAFYGSSLQNFLDHLSPGPVLCQSEAHRHAQCAGRSWYSRNLSSAKLTREILHEANRFLDDAGRRLELREELDVIADSLGERGGCRTGG